MITFVALIKIKNTKNTAMANNNKPVEKDPEVAIEQALSHSEQFLQKNGKLLIAILVAIILVVGGYFAYEHLYKAPRAESASASMFQAQDAFARDSFALALKGNDSFAGFEEIISSYSGTAQSNIAKHYAGICYLYMGEFQKAIDSFNSFSAVEGAMGQIITSQNFGLMGDAYVELGDMTNGLAFYEKAASYSDNIDTTPAYLFKAAMVNSSIGNNAKAKELFETIKNNFPRSLYARDIDKYIAVAAQKL
ncbi:MAG: tetratricopeptide repeat protein [Mucinivorans sp.]